MKELDELMKNGIPRNVEDDQKSKSTQRKSFRLHADENKSFRSGNLVLDRQQKIIKQLRNMSEKFSDIGTNDLSRSFTKSQVDTQKQQPQPFYDLKKMIMQKNSTNKNSKINIKVKPVLTRSPTLNLPEPTTLKGNSAREIDMEKTTEPSSLQMLKDKHLLLSMEPKVLQLKTSPKGLTTLAKVASLKTPKLTEASLPSNLREF